MPSHDEFDDFFDDDDSPPVVDTRADGRLLRVPLGRLSPNLVNPRTEFGTDDELIDFGKSLARRQNQACPVVSRGAYLKLWPDHADRIGSVDYVLVSGERRYRAGTKVGLAALDCVVDDGVAEDRKTFMEAVVSENVDRQNFDAVEEAYAVQALVTEFGTNRAVAQHFERADGWVTQRILLTYLAPNMQALVRKRGIPLEFARKLGKLARDGKWTAEQQADWWEDTRRSLMAKSEEKKAEKKTQKAKEATPTASPPSKPKEQAQEAGTSPDGSPSQPQAPSFTAVKPDTPAETQASTTDDGGQTQQVSFTAVKQPGATTEPAQAQPEAEQATQRHENEAPVRMPWHSPTGVLRILRDHMQPADFEQLVKEAQAQL
ncbi:hypothetical protein [Streptomyces olivaceiscleroticus]|uniref:ParB/Sulfiredoxin domain-containing protein n=1 Tax=Streptomyces olivaceiscleroticus TaxID=68245 RepID=A0ABP3LMK2_9ACTN